MSNLQDRMSALTGGNVVSTSSLQKLFAPAGEGSSGSARRVEPAPNLRTKPGLS